MGLTDSTVVLSAYQQRVLTDGASAYWPLDDPSGTVARDLFGTEVGVRKAYLQARSGIARSDAVRSNYVFPLVGVVTVGGVDLTESIRYGTLRINLALNEQPDTCAFDVHLTDPAVQAALVVGADVLIGLGGPAENALFGGRVLTAQTTRGLGGTPSLRSVMCADYLQVLDSEYLVTYDWPPQSATTTILDLIARFANKAGGVAISTAGVQANLPTHATFAVANERISTVLRRLVTTFPAGGGFYVDPLKVLRVWAGASEPNVGNPAPLTLENPTLKAFAETIDAAQVRDAVIVEGVRTTALLGSPPPTDGSVTGGRAIQSLPVADARIIDQGTAFPREVRIGTQRLIFGMAQGAWESPPGTTQTALVTANVAFAPGAGTVTIPVDAITFFTGRALPWVRINDQILRVVAFQNIPPTLTVPGAGFGAMTGPIAAGAVATVLDSLGAGDVTARYEAPGAPEQVRAQAIDSEVVMTVRSATPPAVHEHLVQDGRYSRTGATNRGEAELTDFSAPLVSIQFETDDWNARPGRLQAYNLVEPPLTPTVGELLILTAELTWPVWGQPPRRVCQAADVHAARVVDTWFSDSR